VRIRTREGNKLQKRMGTESGKVVRKCANSNTGSEAPPIKESASRMVRSRGGRRRRKEIKKTLEIVKGREEGEKKRTKKRSPNLTEKRKERTKKLSNT